MTFTKEEMVQAEFLGLGPFKRYAIGEAANHLGIDYALARRMTAKGELETTKVGKRVFVLGGHIVRWKMRYATAVPDVTRVALGSHEDAFGSPRIPATRKGARARGGE
jgi:hypothetical protein